MVKNTALCILVGMINITSLFINNPARASLSIELPEPKLVLPQITSPISASEARIKKKEQVKAQQIAHLLDEKNYAEVVALIHHFNPKNRSAALDLLLAQIQLQEGDVDAALENFKSAVEKHPNFARAYHGMAVAHVRLEQHDQALKYFTKAISLGMVDAYIYGYLGYIYTRLENFHAASVAYEQALILQPGELQWKNALLYSYSQSGQTQTASVLLEQLLKQDPDNVQLWLHRTQIKMNEDDTIQALSSIEMAIRLGDNDPKNLNLCAQLHLRTGSIDRGVNLLQESWQIAQDKFVLNQAIDYLLFNKNFDAATKLIENISSQSQLMSTIELSVLSTNRGRISQHQGDLSQAFEYFEQALKYDPINGKALIKLAQIQRQRNSNYSAEMLLLRAAQIDEVRVEALSEHADMVMSNGRYKEALRFMREALQASPNNRSIYDNVLALEALVRQQ